jgi:hypothetical protein
VKIAAMPNPPPIADVVAHRRARLRLWINTYFNESQAAFIADCALHGHELNQGEISGLLKKKSFGEKRARSLELQSRMTPGWLDRTADLLTNEAILKTKVTSLKAKQNRGEMDDANTLEAIEIMRTLPMADRRGAVTVLKMYAQNVPITPKKPLPAPDAAAA